MSNHNVPPNNGFPSFYASAAPSNRPLSLHNNASSNNVASQAFPYNHPPRLPLHLATSSRRPPSLTIVPSSQPTSAFAPLTPQLATVGAFGTPQDVLLPSQPRHLLHSALWFSPVQLPSKNAFQFQSQAMSGDRSQPFTPLLTHYEMQSFQPPLRAPAPAPHFTSRAPQAHQRGRSMGVVDQPASHFQQYEIPTKFEPRPTPFLRAVSNPADLAPVLNPAPKYRRALAGTKRLSLLNALTVAITTLYSLCLQGFNYQLLRNPRRALTKPSEPKHPGSCDNVNSDYILYVNEVLGSEHLRKYLVLDVVGRGTFGQVAKCQNLSNKEILAIKVIKLGADFLNPLLTEIQILELINYKIDPYDKHHFLRLRDKFQHKGHLCIAFELLGNNLYETIKQNSFLGLEMDLVKLFARQLLSLLIVLKLFKIVHCDLKPENILLVSPDKTDLKIIDFGSACFERQSVYTYIQLRFYRSPEVILGLPYTCAIDMWSFGCIIAELYLGLPLLPGSNEYSQLCRIIDIFGYPPSWMIEMGKNAGAYLDKIPAYPSQGAFNSQAQGSTAFYKHKLKSPDKYAKETQTEQKPYKNYFNSVDLAEIILNYEPKNRNIRGTKRPPMENPVPKLKKALEQERNDRLNLLQFLRGILNINPLERWTPQQAIAHPFVNNLPYNEHWTPPGPAANPKPTQNNNPMAGSSSHRQRMSNMHRRGQLSASAVSGHSRMGISTTPTSKYAGGMPFINNSNLPYSREHETQYRQEQNSSASSAAFTFGSANSSVGGTPSSDHNITGFKFPLQ